MLAEVALSIRVEIPSGPEAFLFLRQIQWLIRTIILLMISVRRSKWDSGDCSGHRLFLHQRSTGTYNMVLEDLMISHQKRLRSEEDASDRSAADRINIVKAGS